jgi:hypothetical protein
VIEQKDAATFAIAPDGVDPAAVPRRTLSTGATIPAIGLGTFGSDRFSGEPIAQAVLGAAAVGYRHFDCAAVSGNEHLIGHSLHAILAGGVRRGLSTGRGRPDGQGLHRLRPVRPAGGMGEEPHAKAQSRKGRKR